MKFINANILYRVAGTDQRNVAAARLHYIKIAFVIIVGRQLQTVIQESHINTSI